VARTRVTLITDFTRFRTRIESAIKDGLQTGGHVISTAARSVPTDYRLGGILGSIRPSPVYRTRRGFAVDVAYFDFRGLWFEKGTYRKLGALKTRPRAGTVSTGNRGVRPGRFLKKGLAASENAILLDISRRLPH
jgi:hypothetical protein